MPNEPIVSTSPNIDDPNKVSWFEKVTQDPQFAKAYAKESFTEDFLNMIDWVMEDRCVTRSELAEEMGCSVDAVQHAFENHGDLDVSTMAEMARALGYHVSVSFVPIAPPEVCEESVSLGMEKISQLFQDLFHTHKKIEDLEWEKCQKNSREWKLALDARRYAAQYIAERLRLLSCELGTYKGE